MRSRETPADISGNVRHDHWHVFSGRGVCMERTAYGRRHNAGRCGMDRFNAPPPRRSPMPDYAPTPRSTRRA